MLAAAIVAWFVVTRPPLPTESHRWIRGVEPFRIVGRAASDEVTLFRRRFVAEQPDGALDLGVESLGTHKVMLDDRFVGEASSTDARGHSSSRSSASGRAIMSALCMLFLGAIVVA